MLFILAMVFEVACRWRTGDYRYLKGCFSTASLVGDPYRHQTRAAISLRVIVVTTYKPINVNSTITAHL